MFSAGLTADGGGEGRGEAGGQQREEVEPRQTNLIPKYSVKYKTFNFSFVFAGW